MATIHEKLAEWCETSGVKPFNSYPVQSAFLAGAAAMAELFASGEAERTLTVKVDADTIAELKKAAQE
jgi:hypothetical protein